MKLFDLQKGDTFMLNDKQFICQGFVQKFMPTIGKVMVMKSVDNKGNVSLFSRNWEVESLNRE